MFKDIYTAWHFISTHPNFMDEHEGVKFETFPHGLDINVVKVNPDTMRIDDDSNKNIKIQVWLEYGPYELLTLPGEEKSLNQTTHDIDLDCGANTFELAIIEMAELIKKKYGGYESQ